MIEERYIGLINKEIDGMLSPEEKSRLHEYLNDDHIDTALRRITGTS